MTLLAQGPAQYIGDRIIVLDHEHTPRNAIAADHDQESRAAKPREPGYLLRV